METIRNGAVKNDHGQLDHYCHQGIFHSIGEQDERTDNEGITHTLR